VVLTIHDCVFLHKYTGFKAWLIRKLYLEWPVRRAEVVTAISEATKQEVVEATGCDPDRVMVIPDPITVHAPVAPRSFDTGKPRILFIGFHANKNLDRAVESLRGISCRLVLLGRYEDRVLRRIEEAGVEYETHYKLSEEGLLSLYQGCDMLLFPSLYEGFGMPILEAQAAGRAVVTSDASPMRDVAKGGACLVDPQSVESIRSGVLRVINDAIYRETLVRRGFEVASAYQPEKVAQAYSAAYAKCLSGRSVG
jgi:glycosyltransferase involved in cell wall biosynthesis